MVRKTMLDKGHILNAYEIHSVIGQGGFGVVYKGRHLELEAEVAIKEYFPSELCVRRGQAVKPSKPEFQSVFEENLDRFIREAKQLQHFRDCLNIVTCRDLFRANGTAYIIMDYVHGLSLSALLERRESSGKPFTQHDLLQVILPLLEGVQIIHKSGVCHRDIKPSNILIRKEDSVPVLIDFGSAKHEVSRHTKSLAPYSDGYAAMEQIGEGEIGPWTDIYGVGAVMWRMVAGGNPPFSPPNPLPTQQRVLKVIQGHHDPLPPAVHIGDGRFSNDILRSIDDCMTINPNDRIKSCHTLLSKLLRYSEIEVEPILPKPVISPSLDPLAHKSNNKVSPLDILLMLIGGTLLILGGIIAFNLSHNLATTFSKTLKVSDIISSMLWNALPVSSTGFIILIWGIPHLREKWYKHSNEPIYAEDQNQNGSPKRMEKKIKHIALIILSLIGIYVFFIGIFVTIFHITYYAVRPPWLLLFDDVQSDILVALIVVALSITLGLFIFKIASINLKK